MIKYERSSDFFLKSNSHLRHLEIGNLSLYKKFWLNKILLIVLFCNKIRANLLTFSYIVYGYFHSKLDYTAKRWHFKFEWLKPGKSCSTVYDKVTQMNKTTNKICLLLIWCNFHCHLSPGLFSTCSTPAQPSFRVSIKSLFYLRYGPLEGLV